MSATLLSPPSTRETLIPVGADTWRVIDARGRALGHIKRDSLDGVRFAARRFHVPTGAFRELGTFWSIEEACACLRGL